MKIIFSPSKDMTFKKKVNNEKPMLNNLTKEILKVIKSLEKSDLQKALKINDEILEEVINYYTNIDKGPFYEGLNLYNGMSFKELNRDFTKEDREYLTKHLLILSALYGPIKPFEIIAPYRLDMNTKIKVDNKNLKNFWKEYYNSLLEKDELVFNLASDEFSSLFNRKDFKFIDFNFYKLKNNELKTHSTTSKKSRGIMLNYLYKNKIEDVETLKKSKIDKLTFREDLSKDNELVYILED